MQYLKSHINNFRALQFLQLFRVAMLLLIGIFLSKSGIGISQIGTYESFLLIAGSVSFFWLGGMLQALLVDFQKRDTNHKSTYFNVFLLLTMFSIIVAAFVLLFRHTIGDFFGQSNGQIPYLRILILYIIFSGPVNLIEYIYLLENKPFRIFWYGLIAFGLQLVLVVVPVFITSDLGYGLYGLVFVNILKFGLLLILVYKYSELKFSKDYIKKFLSLSAPLIASILFIKGVQYIDGWIVLHNYGEGSFAMFRYGAKEIPLIVLSLGALGDVFVARFSKESEKTAFEMIRKSCSRLMNTLLPLTMILMLTSRYFYPLIFNQSFGESAIIFNIFCFASLSRFFLPNVILLSKGKINTIMVLSFVSLSLNVILSLVLIKYIGIIGVAIATALSFFIEKMIMAFIVKKTYGIRVGEYIDTKLILLYTVGMLICMLTRLII